MIEELFDRLYKQAGIRVDKATKIALAKLEKDKQRVLDDREKMIGELLSTALKTLLKTGAITKEEAKKMAGKYKLTDALPRAPATKNPARYGSGGSGGCGSMQGSPC